MAARCLARGGGVRSRAQARWIDGLPYPSGANAERIASFLGRRQRKELSAKTNAETLEAARSELVRKLNTCAA